MKKTYSKAKLFLVLIFSVFVMSCQIDHDCTYINSVINNTSYEITVYLSSDSTIVCLPEQETIIEELYGGSGIVYMSSTVPNIFKNNMVRAIIDNGNKILTKDVFDDNNWSVKGDKGRKYYWRITYTFAINAEDLKNWNRQ